MRSYITFGKLISLKTLYTHITILVGLVVVLFLGAIADPIPKENTVEDQGYSFVSNLYYPIVVPVPVLQKVSDPATSRANNVAVPVNVVIPYSIPVPYDDSTGRRHHLFGFGGGCNCKCPNNGGNTVVNPSPGIPGNSGGGETVISPNPWIPGNGEGGFGEGNFPGFTARAHGLQPSQKQVKEEEITK